MIEIAFESLLADPETTLHSIFSWLHLDYTPQTFDRRYTKENRTERGERRESIEQYNAELGYE